MNTKNAEINLLTKESISESAANILINNMQLSVTAICKLAGVSRNAWSTDINISLYRFIREYLTMLIYLFS